MPHLERGFPLCSNPGRGTTDTRTLEATKAVAVALLNEFGKVVKKKGDYDVISGVVCKPTVEKEVESTHASPRYRLDPETATS